MNGPNGGSGEPNDWSHLWRRLARYGGRTVEVHLTDTEYVALCEAAKRHEAYLAGLQQAEVERAKEGEQPRDALIAAPMIAIANLRSAISKVMEGLR